MDVNQILDLLLKLVITLSPYWFPQAVIFIKTKWEEIKSTQPQIVQDAFVRAAKVGIAFVEQKFSEVNLENDEKLQEAILAAREYLELQGFNDFKDKSLEVCIEALLKETKADLKKVA